MIINSSIFEACQKADKHFWYQLDTSDGSLTLGWEWETENGKRRYGRMISGVQIENCRDLSVMIADIADERNW